MGLGDIMMKNSIMSMFQCAIVTLASLLFGDAGQPRVGIHATGQLCVGRSGLPQGSDN